MSENIQRRDFLKKSSYALGMSALGTTGINREPGNVSGIDIRRNNRLPREVWVASLTLTWMNSSISREQRIKAVVEKMKEIFPLQPDIVCIPETFTTGRSGGEVPVSEQAEKVPGPVISIFSELAEQNNCYIICPIITEDNGRFYNAAVLIDRKGSVVGEYRKMYPVSSETKAGITPGPAEAPVFETDFGRIGMQICFDANWDEGWRSLHKSGAEIVFFASMFDGGRILNNAAWKYEYNIVSSTWDTPERIIDITGDELHRSGTWPRYWVCGPINLDRKVFNWNQYRIIDKIREKYGSKLLYKSYQDEGCLTIESNSPDITISEVMKEFDLITYRQYLQNEGAFSDINRL